jgi:hypothetical protein
MLLYVAADGLMYTIDSKLNIISTGIRASANLANSLVDGEYVTTTRAESNTRLYMAFDIYYYKGLDVRSLPLTDGRLDRLNEFMGQMPRDDTTVMVIKAKTFYGSDDILKDSKNIIISGGIHNKFKDDELPYYIDGLIFTPKYLPVGGLFPNDPPKDGTWPLVFKWKPPQYNSIDFYASMKNDDFAMRDSKVYRIFTLMVGSTDENVLGMLDPLVKKPAKNDANRYKLVPFSQSSTCNLEVDSEGSILCSNGDAIENGMIVEFMYDFSEDANYNWKPMRVRYDKARPNFASIAETNWKSMQVPVTEAFICGDEEVVEEAILNEDELYYNRIYSRDKSATKSMLNFHNHWIKDVCLLGRVTGKIDSLFDIACGRGNDLPRWIKYKVERLVGIDITEDNILNAQDGAYARLQKCRNASSIKHAFITMDASNVIDNASINHIENPSLRAIAKSVWGIENDERAKHVYMMAVKKFKVVTCNFAIHYFFNSEVALKNVCINIAKHVEKSGYFMGTCFDGKKIERLLANVEIGQEVSCKKDDRLIWSITRMYDDISDFGSKIAVYIETIGKKNVEFIVNFDRLEKELSQYGITLFDTATFDDSYDKLLKHKGSKDNKYLFGDESGAVHMSEEEKKLSFLNRWFIFKKNI